MSARPLPKPFALLVLLSFAPVSRAGEVIDRILVKVNSRVVTQSLFDGRVEQTLRESGEVADAARKESLRKAVMEELVNEALLEDRARDLDLSTTEAEIDEQIQRLKEQNRVTTDEDFGRALAASGLTLPRLRDQLRKSIAVQRVVGREVNSKVDLSDDALRIIYEREKETWKVPERARLAEILISAGDDETSRAWVAKRAREVADRLKQGKRFEELVPEFSDGTTKTKGGDLGVVARGELVGEIDRVVFSLPEGAVSDPIQTKFGWHIVKLVEKIPASWKPFGEVKADILKREQDTQFQRKLAEYLEKLKGDAVIKVSEEGAAYYTAPAPAAREVSTAPPKKG